MLRWQWTALAIGLLLCAGGQQVRADNDVIRLGGADVGAKTQTLGFDGDVQTVNVWGWRRGYYGGWGRGYYGGWGRGYGYGWGGYRPYYGYGYGYYRPYYRGYYAGYYPYYGGYGGYYGGYYPSYYGGYGGYGGYYGGYYPSYGYGYYGCAENSQTMPRATVLGSSSYSIPAPRTAGPLNPGTQAVPPSNGTFPYNGGPQVVPLPSDTNAPAVQPPPATVPREGKLVSIPSTSQPTTYFYRAYSGSTSTPQAIQPAVRPAPAASTSAPSRVVSTQTKTPVVRVTYPAYGQ